MVPASSHAMRITYPGGAVGGLDEHSFLIRMGGILPSSELGISLAVQSLDPKPRGQSVELHNEIARADPCNWASLFRLATMGG